MQLDPLGPGRGHTLLEEEVAVGAVGEALERGRPVVDPPDRPRGDGEVVVHQVELGETDLLEEDLVRVANLDLVTVELEKVLRLGRRHACDLSAASDAGAVSE
jgi:hypothetical protein